MTTEIKQSEWNKAYKGGDTFHEQKDDMLST